jgi:hypothetical protein
MKNLMDAIGPKTPQILPSKKNTEAFVTLGLSAALKALATTPMADNEILLEAVAVTETIVKKENVAKRDDAAVIAVQRLLTKESESASGNAMAVSMVYDLLTSAKHLMGNIPTPKMGAVYMMGAVIGMTVPFVINQNAGSEADSILKEISDNIDKLY